MDKDKIINNIIEQNNVNDMKNELINLKGYLNTIDVKITSLNNEEEKIKKEYEELVDKIFELKEAILDIVKTNYDNKTNEYEDEKEQSFEQLLDKINCYDKYKNKLFFSEEQLNIIKKDKDKLKKSYDGWVIEIHEFKKQYLDVTEKFEEVIDEYINDDERENKFDNLENNNFVRFIHGGYFPIELMQDFMNLFIEREILLTKWEDLDINLINARAEKDAIIRNINALEIKINELLEERKQYVDTIQKTVDSASVVIEKGVKDTVKVGTAAYKFIKEQISSEKEEVTLDEEQKRREEYKKKMADAFVEGAITEGKKRIKSFFDDMKNNK